MNTSRTFSTRDMLNEMSQRTQRFTTEEIRTLKNAVEDMDQFNEKMQKLLGENEQLENEICILRQKNEGLPEHSLGLQVKFKPRTSYLIRPDNLPDLAALRAYAANTDNQQLKYDILIWIGDAKEENRPIEPTAEQIIAESIIAGEKRREAEKRNET